jgi:hypothetical protein
MIDDDSYLESSKEKNKGVLMFLFLMSKSYIVQWLIKAMLEKKMILKVVPTRKIFCSHNILSCSHNILYYSLKILFCSHKKDILFTQYIILFPQHIIFEPHRWRNG